MKEAVCIFEPIHPAGVARLKERFDVVLPDEIAADPRVDEARLLLVRTAETAAIVARMTKLRLIVKHGAGVDNIDIPAATRRGIMVCNTPGGNNSTAVAEGAVALMLALLRQVREMDALVRDGRFDDRRKIRLGDLTGARVGLLGFGRIARCAATICGAGFGCDVAAFDPFISAEDIRAAGVEPLPLAEIMRRDVISIHTPLTPDTRNLVGAPELALMHESAIIVNCSRGGIIDEAALVEVLKAGAIRGAGIDVFETEPPLADHPLFGLPNVILSPHVAGVTENGMKDMALNCARVIETFANGGRPATVLNPEVIEESK
jgi:phosphoglycerate dehydrogenase-like enzyme